MLLWVKSHGTASASASATIMTYYNRMSKEKWQIKPAGIDTFLFQSDSRNSCNTAAVDTFRRTSAWHSGFWVQPHSSLCALLFVFHLLSHSSNSTLLSTLWTSQKNKNATQTKKKSKLSDAQPRTDWVWIIERAVSARKKKINPPVTYRP